MTVAEYLREKLEDQLPPNKIHWSEEHYLIWTMLDHLKQGGDPDIVIERIEADQFADEPMLYYMFFDTEDCENMYHEWAQVRVGIDLLKRIEHE